MKFAFVLAASLAFGGAAYAQDHGSHAGHGAAAQAGKVEGVGVVRAIDAKKGSITIAHEPIKALNWPSMTMPFKVSNPALLSTVKVGAKVRFDIQDKKIVALRPF